MQGKNLALLVVFSIGAVACGTSIESTTPELPLPSQTLLVIPTPTPSPIPVETPVPPSNIPELIPAPESTAPNQITPAIETPVGDPYVLRQVFEAAGAECFGPIVTNRSGNKTWSCGILFKNNMDMTLFFVQDTPSGRISELFMQVAALDGRNVSIEALDLFSTAIELTVSEANLDTTLGFMERNIAENRVGTTEDTGLVLEMNAGDEPGVVNTSILKMYMYNLENEDLN